MAIENKGDINSVVADFELFIEELKSSYPHLQPEVRKNIQSYHTNFVLGRDDLLDKPSIVVAAHNVQRGTLPLYIKAVPPKDLDEMHCELTVTDTDGNRATWEFVVSKVGR